MNGDKLSLRDRCRVRDEEHVRILESIAADSTHPGFQLVAIRDLMDRGWGAHIEPFGRHRDRSPIESIH